MNANIPPLKVWVKLGDKIEHGYAFAVQSYRGRALQFHVLLESGAHFRHVPLHWLSHEPTPRFNYDLTDLQLWDCFSYRPVVTVFDLLKDYECDVILRNKQRVHGCYWFTVDWLPDSDSEAGFLLQPDQNKCAHVIKLSNGQIACQPTNRVAWKDGFFIGNNPAPEKQNYETIEDVFQAETCERWSVADKREAFY